MQQRSKYQIIRHILTNVIIVVVIIIPALHGGGTAL